MISSFHRSICANRGLLATLIVLIAAPVAQAAPGYTYELIWAGLNNQYPGLQERYCPGVAINNHGDVVFRTSTAVSGSVFSEHIRVYVRRPAQSPELVYESATNNNDPSPSGLQCNEWPAMLGINDDGVVAVPSKWVTVDANGAIIAFNDNGYVLVQPGVGPIRELRGLQNSSGRLNNNLQLAGWAGHVLTVTNGIATETTSFPFAQGGFANLASVNADGVAFAGGVISAQSSSATALFRAASAAPMDSVVLGTHFGPSGGGDAYTDFFTPGANDRGWASFSTNFNNTIINPNPRVLLIGPTGTVFPVAEAAGTDFENFFQTRGQASQGTSLNNFNRVSFVAQLEGEFLQGPASSIYVGDASGDAPRLAIGLEITFPDGQRFITGGFNNDVADHGTNSINDLGEIAVSSLGLLYDEDGEYVGQRQVLFIARPNPGLEPGNPIIPRPEDALPGGGWRIWGCTPARLQFFTTPGPRCFVDPPIAVGYDYAMEDSSQGTFTSILIPVPLPGGDSDFVVEFNGVYAALTAGTALNFVDAFGVPVRQFRISGINQAEALDPEDPTVFVAGLTFSEDISDDMAFTMVPVIEIVGDGSDNSPPVITPTISGTLGTNNWYVGDVLVSWLVVDNDSPVGAISGCEPASVTSDGSAHSFACSASSEGGTASETVTIMRDATPPLASHVVSPMPNALGWHGGSVVVTFSGQDNLSGIASCTSAATLTTEGINQAASGTCIDRAGNISSQVSVNGINIDLTDPLVSAEAVPLPGATGWNSSAVTVSFSATDLLSGVPPGGCDSPVVLGTDGAGQSANGSCRDRAENAGQASVAGINIDRTAPVASATITPAPNAAGWNHDNATVSFSGTDAMSGSGVAACTAPAAVTTEGAGQVRSGTCNDVAGNASLEVGANVSLDKTPPVAAIFSPLEGAVYDLNQAVAADYECTDTLSGIAACSSSVVDGGNIDTATVGPKQLVVNATDRAGNSGSASRDYTVRGAADTFVGFLAPTDNLPVINKATAGRTIPVKWQIVGVDGSYISDLSRFISITSAPVACGAAPGDSVEEQLSSPGGAALRYDSVIQQFIYNWQSAKSWRGCRMLQLTLRDLPIQHAKFEFR